ncbi:MAG: hypothetical protein JWN41_1085 [Thermoleophilia bacterium]|nr:hypothetical protein [Thermoleophilia bacterium]
MNDVTLHPPTLPPTRMLGNVTPERRRTLALIDVIVNYVAACHRESLRGWEVHAALVEGRSDFRGGETVALRAQPDRYATLANVPPFPDAVLVDAAARITASCVGIAQVVADIASTAPDVDGFRSKRPAPWLDGVQTA